MVATDIHGEVFSVARWSGVKTKEMTQKLGKEDGLRPVSEVQRELATRVTKQLRQYVIGDRKGKQDEARPLREELRQIVVRQRQERHTQQQRQDERWKREAAERAGRFRRGLGIVLDVLTGHLFKQRKRNEAEAYAAFVRDRAQRHTLYDEQTKERMPVQRRIEELRKRHKGERQVLASRLAIALKAAKTREHISQRPRRDRGHDLTL